MLYPRLTLKSLVVGPVAPPFIYSWSVSKRPDYYYRALRNWNLNEVNGNKKVASVVSSSNINLELSEGYPTK